MATREGETSGKKANQSAETEPECDSAVMARDSEALLELDEKMFAFKGEHSSYFR
jgi:hypothetical protein